MENDQEDSNSSEIPEAYSNWNNPSFSWSDVILSFLTSYFLDFSALDNQTLDPNSEEAANILDKLRTKLNGMSSGYLGRVAVEKWVKAAGCGRLAEYSGTIPVQKDILNKWEILSSDKDDYQLPDCISTREHVPVLVRFPATLMSAEERDNAKVLDYSGCLEVKELDLTTFAPGVPFMIQFHGGGMIMGTPHRDTFLNATAELVSNFLEENANVADPPDIVTISVDYGLAPELPFPAGIIDALSVVEFLMKDNPNRRLHLMGESAGANLSVVAALESFRRYPGQIRSVQSQCPMLNPAGDSLCYYMNQNAFPATDFLRWCWRAYLGLEAPKSNGSDSNSTSREEALRNGSNHDAWEEWRKKHPKSLQRLIDPGCDLPQCLNIKNAPKIIFEVNQGDPMFEDGKKLAEALQQEQANVLLFADKGLHCSMGGTHDKAGHKKAMQFWSEAIFASDD
ncbi:alpha/beta fold family hydrolase [Nitzschia inconspicua]|uniref:Alpha/beta fold family hydrolase n=1 Tax=Nitzschia inconspicua TaxID=303405 RepID=A0A9K3PIJ5_9STRA|nr:alpha/beta fold family hydrolase [Nitzschia inconspicua]